MKNKNIYKQSGKYIIKKQIYNKVVYYGSFNSFEEALEKKRILIENNWIKSEKTGYTNEQSFKNYDIILKNNKYYVKNGKKTYGKYEDEKFATLISKIMPFYENDIQMKFIEEIATREFYKYICYSKDKRYHVAYKNNSKYSSTNLITALEERDLTVKYLDDDESKCNDQDTYYYDINKIPKFKSKATNINYISNHKHPFHIIKHVNGTKITISKLPTFEQAKYVQKHLQSQNWSINSIMHIKKVSQTIEQRDRNIYKKLNKYYIKHKNKRYYNTNDLYEARYIRDKLVETNWNEDLIEKFKYEYQNHRINKEKYHYFPEIDFMK